MGDVPNAPHINKNYKPQWVVKIDKQILSCQISIDYAWSLCSGPQTMWTLEVVERGFPELDDSQVCIKVQAKVSAIAVLLPKRTISGYWVSSFWPWCFGHYQYNRKGVTEWSPDKGWPLQFLWLGDFITCFNAQVPGISYDVGYISYMVSLPLQHLQISWMKFL